MSTERTDGPALAGPLEGKGAFPDQLTARVVTPGARPRLHGYDVEDDLAKHYSPTDLAFLSLTGELPTAEVAAAFGVALVFLVPVSIAHASVHGASLARLCGATTSAVLGVTAIGLAEQARSLLAAHAELLSWLEKKDGALPEAFRARTSEDREAVDRLRAALAVTGFGGLELEPCPSRDAALIMLLHAVGIRRGSQLEAAIVAARLPAAMAEALTGKVVNFNHYPINLPRYEYEAS
jgi:hypothetical protein